jgi:FkbM family methyltransferase
MLMTRAGQPAAARGLVSPTSPGLFNSTGRFTMAFVARPLPFVLASSNHGTMIVNRNDHHMVDEARGYGVGYQILLNSEFDPGEVDMVLQLLALRRDVFGDGVVALDIGANIGVHTIEWARHMHGWGKVIAVEAQERIYYALAGNIAINNCFNARAHHAALGAEEGEMKIPRPNYLVPGSFGSLELRQSDKNEFIGQPIDYSAQNSQTVRMITVDGLKLPRLDFIKMDIEGMELEGLAGALKTIDAHKPHLWIEWVKSDQDALRNLLDAHGYKYYQMGINVLAVHASDPTLAKISFIRD